MTNDLISRQAAIDTCMKYNGYGSVWACIKGEIKQLPSAQPESDEYARGYNDAKREIALSGEYERAYQRGKEDAQRWTPCSERLPEEEGWYLVTIQNDKTRKRRTENDLFAIGIAEAHKHTPYKFCKDGHRQTVIAWMPIPEPYKT